MAARTNTAARVWRASDEIVFAVSVRPSERSQSTMTSRQAPASTAPTTQQKA